MRRTRVLSNIIRNTKLRQAKSSPETAFRSTDFRVPENLIFPALTTTESVISHIFIGNQAKGRISKRVFQENKARHIFRKTNAFTPWYPNVRPCVYQGVKNVCFSKNLTCFAFLKYPLCDSPFCLITDENNYWK